MNTLEYYSYMLRLRIEAGELSPKKILWFMDPIVEYAQALVGAPVTLDTTDMIDRNLNETKQCADMRNWEALGGPRHILMLREGSR